MSIAGIHIGKSIKVNTDNYPVADESSLGTKAIPIEKPLLFKLNIPDATFNYAVAANSKTSACSKQKTTPVSYTHLDVYKRQVYGKKWEEDRQQFGYINIDSTQPTKLIAEQILAKIDD